MRLEALKASSRETRHVGVHYPKRPLSVLSGSSVKLRVSEEGQLETAVVHLLRRCLGSAFSLQYTVPVCGVCSAMLCVW